MKIKENYYYFAVNSWHNINSSRFKFYEWLYQMYNQKGIITKEDIETYIKQFHFSRKFIESEIIGCFYAGFLKKCQDGFVLTIRGIYDFRTFFKECKNISKRIGYTIDFDTTNIVISIHYTMTEPKWLENYLKQNGFSLNKNKFLYRKKYKYGNIALLVDDLEKISNQFEIVDDYIEYSDIFDMMKKCGDIRKTYHDYRCYINHLGMYDSESFLIYKDVYVSLIDLVKLPIDWGGPDFTKVFLMDIFNKFGETFDDFFNFAIRDGMIRKCDNDPDKLTITGKCYTICQSYISKFYKNRLSVSIEHKQNTITLYVGKNSLYCADFEKELTTLGFSIDKDYWYYYKLQKNSLEGMLLSLIKAFKINIFEGENK